MSRGELARDLLAAAQAAGFPLTDTQLARWHRAGLLPRPQQVSLGRGRGTVTSYPEGTTAQLLALCQIRQSDRSLARIGFRLWWDGHDVEPHLVLEPLLAAADEIDVSLRSTEDDARASTPAARILSRRLGKSGQLQFNDHARALTREGGPEATFDWEELCERPLPAVKELPELLARLVVTSLSGRSAREAIEQAPPEALAEGRDLSKAVIGLLRTWAGALAWLLGERGAVLKMVADIANQLTTADLPNLVVAQVIIRPALPPELVDVLRAPIPTPPLLRELETIQAVREAVPEADKVLTPAAIRALQRGGEAATRHRKKIDQFLVERRSLVEAAIAEAEQRLATPLQAPPLA